MKKLFLLLALAITMLMACEKEAILEVPYESTQNGDVIIYAPPQSTLQARILQMDRRRDGKDFHWYTYPTPDYLDFIFPYDFELVNDSTMGRYSETIKHYRLYAEIKDTVELIIDLGGVNEYVVKYAHYHHLINIIKLTPVLYENDPWPQYPDEGGYTTIYKEYRWEAEVTYKKAE